MERLYYLLMLSDGMWSGRRVYVVGGGPSLRDFDWSRLTGESWIGCNQAWIHDPPVSISLDKKYHRVICKDSRWRDKKHIKIWIRVPRDNLEHVPKAPGDVTILVTKQDRSWSRSIADGIVHGTNTGTCAINLACILAGPGGDVRLLGFDMRGELGKTANWHNAYSFRRNGDFAYKRYCKDIERHVGSIDCKIFNISHGSATALKCFPIISSFDEGLA